MSLPVASPIFQLPHAVSELVWQDSHSLILVVLLLVVMTLAVVLFYSPQWKPIRIRQRLILIGLRLMGLFVLAVSLMQPVLVRQPRVAEQGAVVIAVDHSYSMGVHDRQRKPAQWVALADGLGRLPEGLRSRPVKITSAVEFIRDKLDDVDTAQSELDYATVSGRSTDEASRHWTAAFSELVKATDALTGNNADLDHKSHLFTAILSLQKLVHAAQTAPVGDRKMGDIRSIISELIAAAGEFQATFDQSLYTGNSQVKAVCDELSKLSRLGLAEQAIVHPDSGLLYRLPQGRQVFGYSLGDPIEPMPLQADGKPVRRLLIQSESNWQDPFPGIRAVLDNLRGVPVDAVIYFSDGHAVPVNSGYANVAMPVGSVSGNRTGLGTGVKSNGSIPLNRSAMNVTGRNIALNVPVICVSSAVSKITAPDWSLSHLAIPIAVYAGESFVIHARVHGAGVKAGTSVDVTCDIDPIESAKSDAPSAAGKQAPSKNLLTRRVTLRADFSADVEFPMMLPQSGSHQIVLKIPAAATELSAENNTASRWIKVIDQKQKVAVIADSATWDFRLLRNSAMDQPGIELASQVLEGNKCSMTADQLRQQDCIVLFDVPAAAMDQTQWNAIDSVAFAQGGMILLVAGNEHLPFEYAAAPLRDWLPYWVDTSTSLVAAGIPTSKNPTTVASANDDTARLSWRIWKGQSPAFHLQRLNLPQNVLQLNNSAGAQSTAIDQQNWDSISGVFRYFPLPSLKPNVRPILMEKESLDAIITDMPYGNGRVVFLGTDELWRLQSRPTGDKGTGLANAGITNQAGNMAGAIWSRLLRGFVEAPYAVTKDGISLDIGTAGISPGDPLEIRCKLVDVKTLWPITIQSIDIAVKKDGEVIRRQSLPADGANPGRCYGSLVGFEPGNYDIEASAEGHSVAYPLHVVQRYNVEMEDPSGNIATLQNLAEASGGRVLTMEQLRDLPGVIAGINREVRLVSVRLWDSSYLLVFVVSCFIVEWALRKRLGLA